MFGFIREGKVDDLIDKMKVQLREEFNDKLEDREQKDQSGMFYVYSTFDGTIPDQRTIGEKYHQLREDFEELDQKVDKLEKYLKVEYVEIEGNISSDDCAESIDDKYYRKLQVLKK